MKYCNIIRRREEEQVLGERKPDFVANALTVR
jgi:hypothetical protein